MGYITDTRSTKQRAEKEGSSNKINKLAQKLNNKVLETNRPMPVKSTNKGK